MVNHIRTLLLNETQSSLRDAGFPYGEPWYVSPSFVSVDIPGSLRNVHSALFGDDSTIEYRISVVNALMPIVSAPDLKDAFSFFDTRSTIANDTAVIDTVRTFFERTKETTADFSSDVLKTLGASYSLFSHTGDKETDENLDSLKSIAYSSFESSTKLGAFVLAYCMQLESARLEKANA